MYFCCRLIVQLNESIATWTTWQWTRVGGNTNVLISLVLATVSQSKAVIMTTALQTLVYRTTTTRLWFMKRSLLIQPEKPEGCISQSFMKNTHGWEVETCSVFTGEVDMGGWSLWMLHLETQKCLQDRLSISGKDWAVDINFFSVEWLIKEHVIWFVQCFPWIGL